MPLLKAPESSIDQVLDALKSRKTATIAGAIPTLIALRSSLPNLLKTAVNKALSSMDGFTGSVDHVDLQFWRGKIQLRGLVLKAMPAPDTLTAPVIAQIDQIAVLISWSELLSGAIVADVIIDSPKTYIAVDSFEPKTGEPTRRRTDVPWQRQIMDAIPFKLNRLVVRQGQAHVRGLPGQTTEDLVISDISLLARNISNNETLANTLKASAELEAKLLTKGWFQLHASGFPFSEVPTFDADLQIRDVDLRDVDFLFQETMGTHVKTGRLDFYAEAAAAQKAFKGYVKPVIDQMHVEKVRGATFGERMKLLGVKLSVKLLRNKQADRVATRMNFEGRFEDPSIGYGEAVKNFLKNAFVQAFRPRIERSVRFSHAGPTPEQTDIDIPLKKKTKVGIFFEMAKETASRWSDDKAPRLSAALSYYTAFSLAPLMLMTVAIAGLAFGHDAAQGEIVTQLNGLIGQQGAEAVQSMMQAANKPATGIMASIVSVITLLIGASGVMTELKDALNRIWRVKDSSGIGAAIKGKLMTYAMVLAIGFLLLVSLVVSAGLAAAGKFLSGSLPIPEFVMQTLNTLVSFGVITVLFAMLYKILPDTKVPWRDVWVGSAVTSALFGVGKLILGVYLGKASVSSSYGAAGSVLVILLWVYYSAMILYFGAEFTKVFADRFGSTRDQALRDKQAKDATRKIQRTA